MTPPRSVDGGEVAPSSIVGRQLGIWLASGVDGDACRHADLGSARNKLAANASALGHVSAKKLVGETQYWKVPHIQVDRGDPYSVLRPKKQGGSFGLQNSVAIIG